MGAAHSSKDPETHESSIDAQMLPVAVATSRRDIGALNYGMPVGVDSQTAVHALYTLSHQSEDIAAKYERANKL